MAQLSPKQYIQQKARNLPVYKCFVNKDWETGRMAQVIVMRRHVNGNVTAGIYLVDLLCLGVKDTLFIFNGTQAEIEERFGEEFYKLFGEIDYNLAHNIVYAGHDFALEFDIKPHTDFGITKFILAEDNDDIPLIEIEVGDDEKPHLMVDRAGQYSDALAKLKKIAGEGNYYYTIAGEFDDDDEEEDEEFGFEDDDDEEEDEDNEEGEVDDDDDDAYYDMDEFDLGEITPLQAQYIYADDLLDEERVEKRAANEILTIQTELALRTLREIDPAYFAHDDKEEDPEMEILESENLSSGVSEEQEDVLAFVQEEMLAFFQQGTGETEAGSNDELNVFLLKVLEERKDNPLVVANIFENAFFAQQTALMDTAKGYLLGLADQYPIAQLTLALADFINGAEAMQYGFIYNSESLTEAFAGKDDLGEFDLNTYSLLQTLVNLSKGDLRVAVRYYYLSAQTEVFSWLLPVVQTALTDIIAKVVEENPVSDDEEDTDEDDDDNEPTLRVV